MPRLYRAKDQYGRDVFFTEEGWADVMALIRAELDEYKREVLNRAAGIENPASSNQPLAPRKPVKRSAKGNASKARIKARKGSGKK